MAERREIEEIFSKAVRAGRRTYFFDVRSTRAGDYYLTMTESKRDFNEDGTPFYKKHKIYLYKEDFGKFQEALNEMTNYIIKEKGEDIISLEKPKDTEARTEEANKDQEEEEQGGTTDFTEVNFDDLGETSSEVSEGEVEKKDKD